MTTSLLDRTRGLHEDLESLERMIVREFKNDVKTHRENIDQSSRVRGMLDKMQSTAQELVDLYEDHDHSRKHEIDLFGGQGSEEDIFVYFYTLFKEITSFHRKSKHSTELKESEVEIGRVPLEFPQPIFTGEECYGRFLDLHVLHARYVNSKFGSKCSYADYLTEKAWTMHPISNKHRLTKQYSEYLTELLGYLEDFYCRREPLASLDKIYKTIFLDFDTRWQEGKIPGWEETRLNFERDYENHTTIEKSFIGLKSLSSSEELECLVSNELSDTLQNIALKSGKSATEGTTGVRLTHRTKPRVRTETFYRQVYKRSALNELKIQRLSWELRHVIEDTVAKTERKLIKTYEELKAEQDEIHTEMITNYENEEEEYIYNPLKLPVGPDGKPIPYWLYKLHGLNRKFECEICGNRIYEGRRAFEKHFNEPNHQLGMQALGIPNTKTFFEITKIEDATRLWDSVKNAQLQFKIATVQEFEDAEGKVYDAETFDLLKKQGII